MLGLYSLLIATLWSFAATAAQQPGLALDCQHIPQQNIQLCVVRTDSALGPFDDVVLYRYSSSQGMTMLESYQSQTSTFTGVGFSDGGRYMWLSWADEGHPYYLIYNTRDFLNNAHETKSIKTVGDYYLEDIVSFTDQGVLSYTLSDGAQQNCPTSPGRPNFKIDKQSGQRQCLKYVFFKTQTSQTY